MSGHSHRAGRVPLERALSKLGISSRTQARTLIEAGKVKVNGTIRRDPFFGVVPETALLEIDGQRVERQPWKTLLFHKTRSTVTTRSDEKGRSTVFSVLGPQANQLHAVGRLDFATTGLLLLTNDTRLSSWLTDPAQQIARTYIVTVRGEFTEEKLRRACEGIVDEGEKLNASAITIRKASGRESHLTVELREGKNREIRRLFSSLGHEVTRLKRVAFGRLELGDLKPGESREIKREEIRALFPNCPC